MEVRGEELNLFSPLPDGCGAKAMDENEGRFLEGFLIGVRTPEVDGCAVFQVEGLWGEAGGGEATTEVKTVEGSKAEKERGHGG